MALTLFTDGSLSVAETSRQVGAALHTNVRVHSCLRQAAASVAATVMIAVAPAPQYVQTKCTRLRCRLGQHLRDPLEKVLVKARMWHRRPLRVIATLMKLLRTTNGSSLSKARKFQVPASFEPWQAGTHACVECRVFKHSLQHPTNNISAKSQLGLVSWP